jgi:hypothetical protein
MAYRFRADGTTGVVAIYEASDDAPFTAPLSYASRVIFHSGLAYPAQIATITGSIVLPLRSTAIVPIGFETYSHQLDAHGQSGIPFVEGRVLGLSDHGGADLPLVGSIPVQRINAGGSVTNQWRWLTLGADATHIWLHEGVLPVFSGSSNLPAITINYEVHILDKVFTP